MNKIKKKIFNVLKNYLLKDITRNLGKIEETDDKIICYVDNKKLKKYRKGKYFPGYELFLSGKNVWTENILELYSINKTIYFIINNMDFETALTLNAGKDVNIIFSNCKFNTGICISSAGEIVFENNQYCDKYKVYYRYNSFCVIIAEKLKFVNDNFINRSTYNTQTNFELIVSTSNLEIINSKIDIKDKDGVISIKAKNTDIKDSIINCYNQIYIESDEINSCISLIKSETEVIIDNKNNNHIMGVKSPKTIYNGVDLSNYNSLDSKNIELQTARISLIEKLRKLRDRCININLSKRVEDTVSIKTKTK